MNKNKTFLDMKNISVTFPGVNALSNVDFSVDRGSIQALIGANGAGKSTLMKVISGVNSHYLGEIYIDNKKVEIRSPKDAKDLGIEIVYQEVDVALIPYLTVAENIMMNTLVNKMDGKHFVDWKIIKKTATKTLERLNIHIDSNKLVSDLSLAQKQMILIARAVVEKCQLLILDEPTAPLSNTETEDLFTIVRQLAKQENVGIIFISHRLTELFEVCEFITIMRDGKVVTSMPLTKDITVNMIVEHMLGRKFNENFPKNKVLIGDTVFLAENITEKKGRVKNINLSVCKGEIVAIAGLVGAGKTELCKTLFGAYKKATGKIYFNNTLITINSPENAVKNKIAFIPEERRKEGVLITDSLFENITVTALNKFFNLMKFVSKTKQRKQARKLISDLGIVTPSENQIVGLLSGGNQQKVVIGKWLITDADLYIFDEPTKGIDVGAKREIFILIDKLVEQGKSVLYASCEFSEILAIADRAYVMFDGEIVKELNVSESSEQELLFYSTGGR